MPWKEMSMEELAGAMGANLAEIREKHRLIKRIIRIRRAKRMSQAALARKLGVSQARVAQIESGIGTARVTFDILLNILVELGYDYRVVTRKAA